MHSRRKKEHLFSEGKWSDSVAQLVEQYTFNVWVLGPSPSGITAKIKETVQTLRLSGFFVDLVSNQENRLSNFQFYTINYPLLISTYQDLLE